MELDKDLASIQEARDLVRRLGAEYLAWFEYVLQRRQQLK